MGSRLAAPAAAEAARRLRRVSDDGDADMTGLLGSAPAGVQFNGYASAGLPIPSMIQGALETNRTCECQVHTLVWAREDRAEGSCR
jgi:hypothetical protein